MFAPLIILSLAVAHGAPAPSSATKTPPKGASKAVSQAPSRVLSAPPPPPPKNPYPKETQIPQGQRLQIKAKNAKEVVIRGKSKVPGPLTSFELTQAGKGHLSLRFVSRDPNWELNTRGGFVAQLNGEEPLEVEPGVLTRSKWPSGAQSVMLSYKGAAPGQSNQVHGEVAYYYCHRGTKACKKAVVPVTVTVQP